VIPFEDAADFVGERVTVEGTVVRTHNSGSAVFLNFGQGFDNAFTAVIFPDDWTKFPGPPEDIFYGRLVRVEGVIEEYQGTPEIIVKDPWQIEIALTLGQPVVSNCECEAQAPVQVVVTATPNPVQLPAATTSPALSNPTETADDAAVTSVASATAVAIATAETVTPTLEAAATVESVAPTISAEQIQKTEQIISWQDAAVYAGQTATVAGQVVDTYNSGKVVFLNFDADFRNTFKVAIFPDAWPLFPAAPEDYYKDKTVQVTGEIKMYQNAPEIVVDHPDQIKIVEQ
jgi:DNA/RNA endonuclease YhcR with UshA esterase domain